jgi:formate dehydrogenase maturation protein FdhE
MPSKPTERESGLPDPAALVVTCDQAIAHAFEAGWLQIAPGQPPSAAAREAQLVEGRVLFDPAHWSVSPDAARRVLTTVCAMWDEMAAAIREPEHHGRVNPAELDATAMVRAALHGEAAGDAASAEILPTALIQLLAARPFLRKAAALLVSGIDLNVWGRGHCPCCGRAPALAMLDRETRARRLWCQWCDTCWPFRRVCCVFCGNIDQEALRHYETDPPGALRVDVCDRCHGYLKTIVSEESKDNQDGALLQYELSSGELDAAAVARGFRRPEHRLRRGEEALV